MLYIVSHLASFLYKGLHKTDEIRTINDIPVNGLTYNGFVEVLAHTPPGAPLRLVVTASCSEARVIKGDQGFGFVLRGAKPVFFGSLRRDGPADKVCAHFFSLCFEGCCELLRICLFCLHLQAGLKLGDQIWEINNINVFDLPHKEVFCVSSSSFYSHFEPSHDTFHLRLWTFWQEPGRR